MRFNTIDEAEKYILEIPKFAEKTGHENLRKILHRLGDPGDGFKVIHIAGTNGKGSVSRMLERAFTDMGYKTGLFTSPHLIRINERISVSGTDITDDDFLRLTNSLINTVEDLKDKGVEHPSFFEFVFLISLMYFEEKNVDIVVLETGLGGRLDATNVLPKDCAVITSIGMDHMQYLGDTIEKIAYEKAGIIADRVPVIVNAANEAAEIVITDIANERNSKVYRADNSMYYVNQINADRSMIDFSVNCGYYSVDNLEIHSLASYELENSVTALHTLYVMSGIMGLSFEEAVKSFRNTLKDFYWPGRMEFIKDNILLDGAHNVPAAKRLMESLSLYLKYKSYDKTALLFAVANDKEYSSIIEIMTAGLMPDRIYITDLSGVRKTSTDTVQKIFEEMTVKNMPGQSPLITTIHGIKDAYKKAKSDLQDNELLVCMGSLYMIAEIEEVEADD